MSIRVAIVVAEPSGDNIAADLIRELQVHQPDIQFSGICGPAMIQEGVDAIYRIEDISSLGIEGLLRRMRQILKVRKKYVELLLAKPPDVFVGIDAPDFNLPIGMQLRRAGVPTVQYVAPTIWAWRQYRVHKLKRAVDQLLTIYPFESKWLERFGISHRYIGHPLADRIARRTQLTDRNDYNFSSDKTIVAVLPGSRINEVSRLAAIFSGTLAELFNSDSNLRFIAPFVDEPTRRLFEQIHREVTPQVPIRLVMKDSLNVIEAADVVLAASGTAALEAALCGKPVVVAYRLSKLSYWLVRLLSNTQYYSMLNHFDQGVIIPEFMQSQCTIENLSREVRKILSESDYRHRMLKNFSAIARQLQCRANHQAAEEILQVARS